MYLLTRILAVPSAVNSAAVTSRRTYRPTTETIGVQQDVGVASRRERKRAEVVHTDGDARTFWERHGDGWPTYIQPRGFSRLALQAVSKPPPVAYIHANQPLKPFHHAQCARGAKVARSRLMASLHDSRVHEEEDIAANSHLAQQAISSSRRARLIRRRRRRCRVTDE